MYYFIESSLLVWNTVQTTKPKQCPNIKLITFDIADAPDNLIIPFMYKILTDGTLSIEDLIDKHMCLELIIK